MVCKARGRTEIRRQACLSREGHGNDYDKGGSQTQKPHSARLHPDEGSRNRKEPSGAGREAGLGSLCLWVCLVFFFLCNKIFWNYILMMAILLSEHRTEMCPKGSILWRRNYVSVF